MHLWLSGNGNGLIIRSILVQFQLNANYKSFFANFIRSSLLLNSRVKNNFERRTLIAFILLTEIIFGELKKILCVTPNIPFFFLKMTFSG